VRRRQADVLERRDIPLLAARKTILANFISAPFLGDGPQLAFRDSALAHHDADKRLDICQLRMEVDDAGSQQVVEFFRQYYGPARRAFATLGEVERAALRAELVQLWSAHNTATVTGRTTVDAEYLEVVATRA
jgi:hypothetical protein